MITPSSTIMTTAEDGRTATFQVVLQTQPHADVTIPLSSSNTAEGALSASSLVFTAANWNVPQTVTVIGVADGIIDGDIPYSTIIGATISTDAEYSGLDPADIALVNVDNDVPGFVYWSDGTGDTIQRARLSGAQPEALVDLKKALGDTVNYAPPWDRRKPGGW